MKIKLFVSHRIDVDGVVIKNDIITPVYCGAVYKKDTWNKDIIGDNTGDNISELRMNFNELTVQYWAWKNIDADYYGLCHYRRYFALQNEDDGYINEQNQIYLPFLNNASIKKYGIGNKELLTALCSNFDLIIPQPADVKNIKAFGKQQNNVLELWQAHIGYFFNKSCLDLLLKTIAKVKPQFYKYAVEYFKQDKHRGYNCYLMRKEIFEELCSFQFPVLFEMYGALKETAELKKYPRTLGYMAEILYGIYLHYLSENNFNQKESRLIFAESVIENAAFKERAGIILKYYGKIVVKNYFPKSCQSYLKKAYHKFYK